MLLVFLLIGIGLSVSGLLVFCITKNGENNPYSYIGTIFGITIAIASIIMLIIGGVEISKEKVIDRKIEIFAEDDNKIKELKENKLDIEVWKWWVYFG